MPSYADIKTIFLRMSVQELQLFGEGILCCLMDIFICRIYNYKRLQGGDRLSLSATEG